jgi:hypothetical protein
MHRLLSALGRIAATVVLVATVAGGFASGARTDDWARDAIATPALAALDPAIRTALAARTLDVAPVPGTEISSPVVDEGFAWGAAALGLGVGIAAMSAAFGAVRIVRHDGRLRNA